MRWTSIDVLGREDGQVLRVSQTDPEGGQATLLVPEAEVSAFVSELLKAVSALAGPQEPPRQHPPTYVARVRLTHPQAYQPWSPAEDERLLAERARGHGIGHLARTFQRNPGAIISRLRKLGDPLGSQPSAVRPNPGQPG